MHVVLAGGGTAGHIEPALNLADALRARDPGVRDHGARHRGGSRDGWCRPVATTCELVPAVPLPRRPVGRAAHAARSAAAPRCAPTETMLARTPGRRRGRFRRLRRHARLSGRPRARVPMVIHEANARPGLANRVGARLHHVRRRGGRGQAADAGPDRDPAAPAHLPPGPGRRARRGPRRVRARPDRPTLLVSGGSQGARRINDAVAAAVARAAAPGLGRCCTSSVRATSTGVPDRRPATPGCRTWTGWTWRTPPRTWC